MLVRLIGQSYLWDEVIWEAGSVLEGEDKTAENQIGMGMRSSVSSTA